jgi:hypothetical protein
MREGRQEGRKEDRGNEDEGTGLKRPSSLCGMPWRRKNQRLKFT